MHANSPTSSPPRRRAPPAEVTTLRQRARALESEIEHRKRLEADLRAELETRVRLEAELRGQNEDLSRAVHFSELFVGILGHDLRNPLSAIAMAASLLERRAESEKVSKPAQRILNSAARMGRMIDQILDFTRIRLGKGISLQPRRIDLAITCRAAVDELESASWTQPIAIALSGDLVGQWDGERLLQLLSSLLGNALARGHAGQPITLRVDGADPLAIALEVHDTGAAVPAELLPGIFEPLSFGPNGEQEQSSGLGIGLFIGRQVVLAHGGSIEVTSSEAEGTRFRVRLPRARFGSVGPESATGQAGES